MAVMLFSIVLWLANLVNKQPQALDMTLQHTSLFKFFPMNTIQLMRSSPRLQLPGEGPYIMLSYTP